MAHNNISFKIYGNNKVTDKREIGSFLLINKLKSNYVKKNYRKNSNQFFH